jgi:SsrA-binding protein
MTNAPEALRTIARNRRARHDYEILDELECGIVLTGTEVKSLRAGKGSIAEAHARVRNGELFLIGAHIPEYAQGNVHNHEPVHDRKLLCHRREIDRWHKRVREQGITIVPLELYFKGSRVKLLLALARGKKLFDKRDTERQRQDRRDMDRAQRRARS